MLYTPQIAALQPLGLQRVEPLDSVHMFPMPCLVFILGIELLLKETGLHIDAVLFEASLVPPWPAYRNAEAVAGTSPGYVAGPEVMVTVLSMPWKGGLTPRLSRGF